MRPNKPLPPTGFLVLLAGDAILIVAVLVLFFARHRNAASFVSLFGPVAPWNFGFLAWIVFFDSRRWWPKSSAPSRL